MLCTATMGFRPLREFISAAAQAGFSAISLSGGDYKAARASGLSDSDIRTMLADHGLCVAEMDGVIDWLNPLPQSQGAGYDLNIPFFGHSEAEFLAMANAVGARSLTAVDPFLSKASSEQMADAFGSLCDRASAHGLLVHLEFLSWGPVPDLATAWEVVRRADRANGGLTLDILHLIRSNSHDLLDTIPVEKIFATQFCDGRTERTGDCFEDAANRLLPGDGEFDLVAILHKLNAKKCTAPLGIEVMNAELASLPASTIAAKAHTALVKLCTQARVPGHA